MEPTVRQGKQERGIALEMYALSYQITFGTFTDKKKKITFDSFVIKH